MPLSCFRSAKIQILKAIHNLFEALTKNNFEKWHRTENNQQKWVYSVIKRELLDIENETTNITFNHLSV
jgi:hypothetical protein